MPRYFLEVAYKGTAYSGFQVQQNAVTVQSEVQAALAMLHRYPFALTGSSRTDAGVHAEQNYFHFDAIDVHPQAVYKLNAILPPDIVVKSLQQMPDAAHARFDAVSRAYEYRICRFKNPFLKELAYYYPFKLDTSVMLEAAAFIKEQTCFQTFSKTHTQVHNFNCTIFGSSWTFEKDVVVFSIEANRFLRGMVRMLTASMLRLGRGQTTFNEYKTYFTAGRQCLFSAPAHGLFLKNVNYPAQYFSN
jgi:tRNA pseudouridine38-40 synthase